MISLPASMRVFERGWLSSNNILFIDDRQTALVDSGYTAHAAQTLALVQHALGGVRTLDLIANTHLHSDHCGGNAAYCVTRKVRPDLSQLGHLVALPGSTLSFVACTDFCNVEGWACGPVGSGIAFLLPMGFVE